MNCRRFEGAHLDERGDGVEIQVVGRLIQKQHMGLFKCDLEAHLTLDATFQPQVLFTVTS